MKAAKKQTVEKPLGPLQARILGALQKKEATAAQILETLNKEEGAKQTTLASIRDALYRGLVRRKLVEKLPVAFAVVKRGKK